MTYEVYRVKKTKRTRFEPSASMPMWTVALNGVTVIDSIHQWFLRLVEGMSPAGVNFVIQVAVLVMVPTALCGAGYLMSVKTAMAAQSAPKPNRGVQISMFVIGLLAGMCLPVNKLEIDEPAARLWIITLCLLIAGFGPVLLGYLIVPDAKAQKNTIRNLYVVILALSVWQILRESFL